MKDLVERLNDITEHDWRVSILAHTPDTAKEAAAEISRLRDENDRLRRGLMGAAVFAKPDAELSRLRALNAELVEALDSVTELLVDTWVYDMSAHGLPEEEMAIKSARAALSRAKGEV